MSTTFLDYNGDIKDVLRTLATSDEFWGVPQQVSPQQVSVAPPATKTNSKAKKAKVQSASNQSVNNQTASKQAIPSQTNLRNKIKSPFELAVSALRAMNADVVRPREVLEWIRKIGQPLYAYQAPTGFPDRAESWINTGALLGRMNFGVNLALGSIAGVKFDLAALNSNHEPQSLDDALETYARLLMPERNLSETLRLLKPVLADPAFIEKVSAEAQKTGDTREPISMRQNERKPRPEEESMTTMADIGDETHEHSVKSEKSPTVTGSALAQVVGIILGSPEFQRR
jgi:hypothetical protein